ncbi:glycosyltransferase family 2 protein [Candidatus Omnitrophota bacterium]
METKGRQTISAIVITKDEAAKIKRCLESVKWVDEIIVVDDQSSDETIETCKPYAQKIIIQKSEGNFDRQRNTGIDNASSDWILQLDADEVVTDRLRGAIEQALKSKTDLCGFYFKRKNYVLGKPLMHGGWYHNFLRLYRKSAGRYIGSSVHELVEVKGSIGYLDAEIEHFVVEDIDRFTARQNYYTSAEAQRMLRERGQLTEKEIRYQMSIKPVKVFFKTYIKKKGFRDGTHGLFYCAYNAYLHAIKWAKYWELICVKKNAAQQT